MVNSRFHIVMPRFNKLPALLLLPVFLFACGSIAAQDFISAPKSPVTAQTDAPDNAPAIEQSGAREVASKVEADGARGAAAGPVLAEQALAAPKNFAWQDVQNQPAAQAKPLTPLTGGEKMNRAFKSAFLNPAPYLTTGVSAAITEATEDDLPHKDTEDRVADFGSRWAIRFTTRTTQTLLGSGVFPILFKQDPRYYPSGKKNVFKRALYAASRVFVIKDDDGNLEPNYSRWAGAFASSGIANIYEQSTPGRDRIGADATLRRFGSSFTSGMINNIVFREFLPDLVRIIKRK